MKHSLLLLYLFLASFVVNAQADCSLLGIELQVNPFNTSEMLIYVSNPEFQKFNYPGFRIFKDGVQIGEENVLFFGLGAESTSRIILSEMPAEGEEVSYTLELWTNFYGNLACSIEYTGVPYLTTECFPLILTVYGSGGGSNFQITLEEENTNSIFLETDIALTSANTIISNPVCLVPGCYSFSAVTTSGVFSSQVYIELVGGQTGFFQFFNVIGNQGETEISGNFEVWDGCSVGVAEIVEPLSVYPNPIEGGQLLNFSSPGKVQIYDLSGRLVQLSKHSGSLSINLKSGVYMLNDGARSTRLIVK
ncbi:MAG: T9SS type A sorting domain-containing protein [Cryomorphaceae bacterium]|nr:T9SS type A sorting domain-containing protein [Cryomorphaceae bacterium]